MPATAMNHFTILTDDVPGTVRFYSELLGLRDGPRPALNFPGAWLYSGGSAILHIVGGRSRADLKSGVIDHMALSAVGLADTLASLTAHGVAHTYRSHVGPGTGQVVYDARHGDWAMADY